ncbi:TetR/AcrR family transcriptional regulator [Elizabethkingia ursingii]|jgi:AcrR family transcriptional regulator|uniref:TetR family transcriptional regulator n=1 Tax=Elizabethkingia ursingii TaxID=1756150 RepID=A0AAJ3NF97_9FLAO|nr:TetR/AcrR family transcriptional regulator [Elizabethkingia ursingii]MDR2228219.1 TetR/AcrR family transcriptional regulator [Flavobacteriaceae bacterium]AQX07510.1 TetR family transcriptional regulator [Elizabethkingia ursingii]MCL1666160.1 TetR/AcrR family transcriptional regulator [Elizabethkingia ursingii]MCL1671274.1 TetR/AcrR family transcriptional regulator [Elizabethkingia ursingii]OPB79640.1 TetR family transcriptional regulator [Elizabethkingia ursingii]
MARKVVDGPIRNKEKTKQKLLNAVGKILATKGYSELKVSKIATVAGLDKKLIYSYFGSTDKLIDEYIKSQDFWANVDDQEIMTSGFSDGGQEITTNMILKQYETLAKNKEYQKVILWGISETRPSLRKLADDREAVGNPLLDQVIDPLFKEKSKEYRAILAMLVAGSYYLNLHFTVNGSTFCGLDFNKEEDAKILKDAIATIIDDQYKKLEKK